jgi:hypothetical protein
MDLASNSVIAVAIGMSFLFFILAVFATALQEAAAAVFGFRSKMLGQWLEDNLATAAAGGAKDVPSLADAFFAHPAVNGLTASSGIVRRTSRPSYVPSEHAITALLDVIATGDQYAKPAYKITSQTAEELDKLFENDFPNGQIKQSLESAWKRADGDVGRFRATAERWFDDAMDRLSGMYKRRVQLFLWGFGLFLAVVLNANAIHIAEVLYNDPPLLNVISVQAGHVSSANPSVATASGYLKDLPLPLGWTGGRSQLPHGVESALADVLGILLASAAVALGAPFWFDALSKLGSLRTAGPAPASTSRS